MNGPLLPTALERLTTITIARMLRTSYPIPPIFTLNKILYWQELRISFNF